VLKPRYAAEEALVNSISALCMRVNVISVVSAVLAELSFTCTGLLFILKARVPKDAAVVTIMLIDISFPPG